jgi:hypothetical protein
MLSGHSYGVMPDGQHFFMVRRASLSDSVTEIRVILNWYDELKRRVPVN